jgi:hypothetical protein
MISSVGIAEDDKRFVLAHQIVMSSVVTVEGKRTQRRVITPYRPDTLAALSFVT